MIKLEKNALKNLRGGVQVATKGVLRVCNYKGKVGGKAILKFDKGIFIQTEPAPEGAC